MIDKERKGGKNKAKNSHKLIFFVNFSKAYADKIRIGKKVKR